MWSEQKHTTGGYVENKAFPSPYLYGIWTMWTYVNAENILCSGVDGEQVVFYYTPCCVETPGRGVVAVRVVWNIWNYSQVNGTLDVNKGLDQTTKKFFVSHGKEYDE